MASANRKKVVVMSVFRQSAQGRHNYDFKTTEGTSISTNRTRVKDAHLSFTFYREGNKLVTGLEEMIPNPYLGLSYTEAGTPENWSEEWATVYKQEKISLQTYYEILDGLPKGTYTSNVSTPTMSSAYSNTEAIKRVNNKTALEEFKLYLNEGLNVFTSETTRGRLGIQLVQNRPDIAKSIEEVNPDYHEFYIAEEEQELREKVTKRNAVMEAMFQLGELMKNYPTHDRHKVATILKLVDKDATATTVEGALQDYVWEQKKSNHGTQATRLEKFDEVISLLKTDAVRFEVRYVISSALLNTVSTLRMQGGEVIWPSQRGTDNLYNLGRSMNKIENMFIKEYETYQDGDEDNAWGLLVNEVKSKGVAC